MRRNLLSLLVCVVAVLASAGTADAYVIKGVAWPGETIRYVDRSGGGWKSAVAKGVKAWNDAKVGITFTKTTNPGAADITILSGRRATCHGDAPLGVLGTPKDVVLSTKCLKKERALIVTHELGHVLGLDHTTGCKTMNNRFTFFGSEPSHPVGCSKSAIRRFRTQLLTADDIAGAKRMYTRPGSVTGVAVTANASRPGALTVSYDAPASAKKVELVQTCDSSLKVLPRSLKRSTQAPGKRTVVVDVGSGRHCLAIQAVNGFGRPSATPVHSPPVTVRPAASISVFNPQGGSGELFGGKLTFRGAPPSPLAADVGSLRYDWNFGDPSSGAANGATSTRVAVVEHDYTRPGSYLVALQITHVPSGVFNVATTTITVR